MPELPEVETIRRTLQEEIVGKIISFIEILEPKQFIGNAQDVIGAKVTALMRKGKYLSIQLSNNLYLNIHLKMSGQILFVENLDNPVIKNNIPKQNTNRLPTKYTRIIIKFADNSALFYNDMRKFGWIKVSNQPDGPPSPDVATDEFTLEYFQHVVKGSKMPIKTFLLDQTKLAGVGNIYANDALWEAGILPTRQTGKLTAQESEKLYHGITTTIQNGITYRGSSAKDENYILPDGSLGGYQNHFKVYHRESKHCARDGEKIKRIKMGGRSSFYCPKCQK